MIEIMGLTGRKPQAIGALAIVLIAVLASISPAASISFSPSIATDDNGATDVSTAGTLLYASNAQNSGDTVLNGVTFQSFASNPSLPKFTDGFSFNGGFGAVLASPTYNSFFDTAFGPFGNGDGVINPLPFTGLTVGNTYLIQVWLGDGRNGQTFNTGPGYVNSSPVTAGAAAQLMTNTWLATGTFVADFTTQNVYAWMPASSNFQNEGPQDWFAGYQIRTIATAIPEPSAFTLALLGLAGFALFTRRRGGVQVRYSPRK